MSENLNPIVLEVEEVRVVNAVSPTVDLSRTENGVLVTVHDYRGTQTVEIFDGSGGSVEPHPGTTDYTDLTNKPSINSVILSGNKSLDDLGIASKDDVDSLEIVINGGTGWTQDITSTAVWATGSVNYATGGIIASTALGHADIDVEDCLHVSGFTDGGAQLDRGACFLDANGGWLWGDYNEGAGTYNWNYSFDVPQNAKTFRITCRISSEDNFTCIATKGTTEGLIDRVEALEENPGIADYTDLTNKPSINSVTLDGNKSLEDFGAASAADVNDIKITINGGESEAQSDISLSSFTQSNFRLMTNGYWSSDGKGYYMELPQGVTKVSIQGHATKDSYLAFLSSYSPVSGTRASIVGDSTSPVVITNGETVTKNVPSTAVYLFLSKQDANGNNISPQSVKYTSVENVGGLINRIDGFENGESVSYTGSYYQLRAGDFKEGSVWRLLLSDTTAEYAELKALTDASDTSTAETQLILYTGEEVLWSPQKDYEAIRYGVNGACKLTINDCTSLYDKMERKVFYCGASRDYTKLIDAIEAAERYMGSVLYVDAGTYDLIDEFGATYFENMSSTSSMPGVVLKNRIHIIFSPNSRVICHYTGDNQYVLTNFSPFNCGQYGFIIENLNLDSSRTRYAVHDERNGGTEQCVSRYVNCNIKQDNSGNAVWSSYCCIGGGLGSNHEVRIENCTFESIARTGTAVHGTVSYHPSNASGTDYACELVVKDNYFVTGTIELSGSRTDAQNDTTVIVTNNSFEYNSVNSPSGIYYSGAQSYQGTHYNVRAWNNENRRTA